MAMSEKSAPHQAQEDHEITFLFWGGINTKTMACTNELFQVKLSPSRKTNQIVSRVCKFPIFTPQYLSSQAATICDNIVYVFGGYMAK